MMHWWHCNENALCVYSMMCEVPFIESLARVTIKYLEAACDVTPNLGSTVNDMSWNIIFGMRISYIEFFKGK